MTYQFAILGGTFDHFHAGHEQLIASAFAFSAHVTIGIVSSLLSPAKLFPASLEDFATRRHTLLAYLRAHQLESRATIIAITDIYGTSLTDPRVEAIFVTAETRANADKINAKRRGLRLAPLTIEVVPYALADDNQVISSSRIRAGEIDRTGHSYLKFFLGKSSYRLPKNLRATLSEPIGPIFTDVAKLVQSMPRSSRVISVGDIVSLDLKKAERPATVSIIDYRTQRHDLNKNELKEYFQVVNSRLENPAGSINPQIAEYLTTNMPQVIAVTGEEDLLALPAILLAPLDSYILYGLTDLGVVVVKVTEETKALVKNYLAQFSS
jgi:phosphopantetheine adenylyltransferase/uncharacterized protein (UPF0218 family)